MENLTFSFQNILNENGITISIIGMLIVFLSLTLISLFIKYLPKILQVIDYIKNIKERKIKESGSDTILENIDDNAELYAAICAVIALEIELSNFGDDQHITLKTGSDKPTAWATVGKMRTLSSRIAS
jgi:Na+-transporting methylmalonyl-CoA/oxaloacetate decarboxylase gamma subunit